MIDQEHLNTALRGLTASVERWQAELLPLSLAVEDDHTSVSAGQAKVDGATMEGIARARVALAAIDRAMEILGGAVQRRRTRIRGYLAAVADGLN